MSRLGQRGSALLDSIPFLVELVVDVALGRPLVLLADVVEPACERVGGLGAAAQAIVERGSSVDAAILGPKTLYQMLTGFPDGGTAIRWPGPNRPVTPRASEDERHHRRPERTRLHSCRRARHRRRWS